MQIQMHIMRHQTSIHINIQRWTRGFMGAPVFHVLPKGSTRIVTTEKVDIDKHTHTRDKIQYDP